MTDSQIIKRVQAGDSEAFALLVSRYHRNLLNFIYRLVGDPALVEDLGQDVFLNVFRTLPDFNPDRGVPFAAWLFILARNRCASELRSRGKRRFVGLEEIAELPMSGLSAEEALLSRERHEALRRSLEQLSEPFRTTLLQRLEGKSLEEMAITQGVSTGTVKSRLFRAKERMKEAVGELIGGKNDERI